MKKIILIIVFLIGMIAVNKEKTVDEESADLIEWLRDGQTGERNATIQIGSFFVSRRSTVYGADCEGCTIKNGIGQTSSQIEVSTESIRQRDGVWKEGVTYEGYYLIAADTLLPMCTILRVSNHSYEGSGIEKGAPFYALVVDRGSAVQKNCIDLFAGKEKNPSIVHETLDGAIVEIAGFLHYEKNEDGRMQCAGE